MAFHGAVLKGIGTGITTALGLSQANKNRRFQREFAQHGVQWRVDDLKAAGLNPILAANMGFGGGTQSGGATANLPDLGGVGEQVTTAKKVSSEKALRTQNIQHSKKQMNLMDAQILKEQSVVGLNNATSGKNIAEMEESINRKNRWQPVSTGGKWGGDVMESMGQGFRSLTTDQAIMQYRRMGERMFRYLKDEVPWDWKGTNKAFKNYLRSKGLYNDNWSDNFE